MPKMKTRKSVAKRFKRTGSGGFKRAQAYHKHELSKMGQAAGGLAGTVMVDDSDVGRILKALPYNSRRRRPNPAPAAKQEA